MTKEFHLRELKKTNLRFRSYKMTSLTDKNSLVNLVSHTQLESNRARNKAQQSTLHLEYRVCTQTIQYTG